MSRQPVAFQFSDDGSIPNNEQLPLLVYRQAADVLDGATVFEELFSRNSWGGCWRNGVFDYHHFHSTAHEVLGVYRGSARILFGGERGEQLEVSAGDVVVIPAGVGHKRVESSPDFAVVGAYPEDQTNDLCTGRPDERPRILEEIAQVPLPKADPVTGPDGPLFEFWRTD